MLSIQRLIEDIHSQLKPEFGSGKVADYIPELAKVDPHKFGIAVETIDGASFFVGDAEDAFSIQSISKVFGLTLALGKHGDALWRRVGRSRPGKFQFDRPARKRKWGPSKSIHQRRSHRH